MIRNMENEEMLYYGLAVSETVEQKLDKRFHRDSRFRLLIIM